MFTVIKRLRDKITNKAIIDKQSLVGEQTYIGYGTKIINSEIRNFCSVGPDCKIGLYSHYLDAVTTHPFINHSSFGFLKKDYFQKGNIENTRKPLIIGNDVYIGANVIILRGVEISDGAVIGAGSIVTKNVPSYAIFAGNPAKLIRYRYNPTIRKKLGTVKWWNWKTEKLKTSIPDFYNIDLFLSKHYIE